MLSDQVVSSHRGFLHGISAFVVFLVSNTSDLIGQSAVPLERPACTYADVHYGPDERHLMDFWQASTDKPAPVLLSIHGGGFITGNKTVPKELLRKCLDSGISVAAISYRYSTQAIAPASFYDGARAVQFLRTKAAEWHLDPERIASSGESAGAGMSLWTGFHQDLADPNNSDPVLRESTRLTCMVVFDGQSSYDPRFIRQLFPDKDVHKVMPLQKLFDIDPNKLDDLPAEKYRLFEEVSAINHVTASAPPVLLWYTSAIDDPITTQRIGIHHPILGKVLKEKMDTLKRPCIVVAAGKTIDGTPTPQPIDFLKIYLKPER